MSGGMVRLSRDDKTRFATEIKTASPEELLTVVSFLEDFKERFTPGDLRFMNSHLGRRAERLLRNVAQYQDWNAPGDHLGA
ncbi:MAG: hypothetical protein ACLUEU_00080 [Oscillospiraceae bacterium]